MNRRAVILEAHNALFLASYNGVLGLVLTECSCENMFKASREKDQSCTKERLPAAFKAVSVTNRKFWRHPVSSTFHGRDIFAPIVAHLSLGLHLTNFGEKNWISCRPPFSPHHHIGHGGMIIAHVIHIDSFGSVTTDVKREYSADAGGNIEIA